MSARNIKHIRYAAPPKELCNDLTQRTVGRVIRKIIVFHSMKRGYHLNM